MAKNVIRRNMSGLVSHHVLHKTELVVDICLMREFTTKQQVSRIRDAGSKISRAIETAQLGRWIDGEIRDVTPDGSMG